MPSVPHDPSSDDETNVENDGGVAEPAETPPDSTPDEVSTSTAGGGSSDAPSGGDARRDEDGGSNGGKNEDPERQMRPIDSENAGAEAPTTEPTSGTPDGTDDNGAASSTTTAGAGTTPFSPVDTEGGDAQPVGETEGGDVAAAGETEDADHKAGDDAKVGDTEGGDAEAGDAGQADHAAAGPGDSGDSRAAAPPGSADSPVTTAASSLLDDLPITTELPQVVDVPDTKSPVTPPPTRPAVGSDHEARTGASTASPPATAPPPTAPTAPPSPPAPTAPLPAPPPTETAPATRPERRGGAYRAGTGAPTTGAPTTGAPTEPTEERPRHFRAPDKQRDRAPARADDDAKLSEDERRRRLVLLGSAIPVGLFVLLFLGWAIDSMIMSGQVARNVEVAGRSVSGVDESSLSDRIAAMGGDLGEREVTIRVPGEGQAGRSVGAEGATYEATAEAMGLSVDEEATADAALDAGRSAPLPLRPFAWAASFFSTNEVSLHYDVAESQTAAALQLLQGEQLTQPTEPTMQLADDGFEVVPGQPGTGLDPATVSDALLAAAEESPEGAITIEAEATDIAPHFNDDQVQALADQANEMTADGLSLKAGDFTTEVSTEQLRSWITAAETDEGGERQIELTFNSEAAQAAVPELFAGLNAEPTNATVRMQGSSPVVVPGQNGTRCRCDEAATMIWEALQANQTEVNFEAEVVEPEHTTEEVEGWAIRQPVGGSRAHQNGADVGGPTPGYTTYHDCCASRVTNIQRIADMVNGAVIAPGESFSINEHVGERTAAKGFVPAGAINEGMHVDEIGGGVSQFFTTLFNAAYFAGLDIDEYQAHTENFSRYPDGREATGGHPNPDLVITNNTPYGVLIATSHTGTSVTVTLWSSPYATAEQTGISSSPNGACTNVTTTRTRRYPDGTTDQDSFSATYRPGEGQFCR